MLIAAVLAAGRSQRMGTNKLLLPLGDRPIIRHVVDAAVSVRPHELLVITNAAHEAAVETAIAGTSARVLLNPRAAEGIGTSIACAANAMADGASTLLVLQGDQPLVSPTALERLIERGRSPGVTWIAARYGGLVTTPVLFSEALFAELRELGGDRGARRVLEKHHDAGEFVDLPPWMGLDVDDADGYRRVQELWPPPSA